jgi:hypothetical protein
MKINLKTRNTKGIINSANRATVKAHGDKNEVIYLLRKALEFANESDNSGEIS